MTCTECELRAERLSSRLGSWDSGSGLSTKMNLPKSDCSSLGAFGSCPSLGPARIVPNDGVDVLEAPVNLHLPLDPLILPRMRGFPGPTLLWGGGLPAARIEGGQRSSYPPSRPPALPCAHGRSHCLSRAILWCLAARHTATRLSDLAGGIRTFGG